MMSIPMFASVAVGGIVLLNDSVLLVKPRYGVNHGHWMIPGGVVEARETLQEAVAREFMEETGVAVRAGRIVGMR